MGEVVVVVVEVVVVEAEAGVGGKTTGPNACNANNACSSSVSF